MDNEEKLKRMKDLIFKNRIINNVMKDDKWVTKEQGNTIMRYVRDNLNMSITSLEVKVGLIKRLAYDVKKPFKKMTKTDLKKFLELYTSGKKPNYINVVKMNIKLFFKWLYKIEERGKYPKIVDWMKIHTLECQEINSKELITFEELQKILIPACRSFIEKFLLSLMRETGGRISEILRLNVSDLTIESDRAYVKLLNSKRRNGVKTYREIVLIDSFYYLNNWLREHPMKKDFNKNKEIPLFLNSRGKRLNQNNVMGILNRIKTVSGYKKRLNPHWFRHSAASEKSKILSDAELRVFGGWMKGSIMIGRYVHINSDEVNNKILSSIGREIEKPSSIKKENLQECPRCGELQDVDKFKFCGKCGMCLDKEEEVKSNIQIQMLNEKVEQLFRIYKNKKVKHLLKLIENKS